MSAYPDSVSYRTDHSFSSIGEMTRGITFGWIFWIYVLVPLSLLVVGIDQFWLGLKIRNFLPTRPDLLLFISMSFNLPHIVASHLILFDKEYGAFYGRKLSLGIPLVFLGTAAMALFLEPGFLFTVGAVTTIYHVWMQQIGITRWYVGKAGFPFRAWQWLSILLFCIFYFHLFLPDETVGIFWKRQALNGLWLAMIPLTFFAYQASRASVSRRGVCLIAVNQILFALSLLFYEKGYPFLAFFMIWGVHNLTAFSIYSLHNRNRNLEGPKNLIFQAIGSRGSVSLMALTPLLGVGIAGLLWLIWQKHPSFGLILVMINLSHYFTESFTWKSKTPHRTNLHFR